MSKKHDINYIRKQFEKEGYELLSEEYVGAHTKLKYICPEGHEHSISWSNWQQGQRCPYCVSLGKPNISSIKSEFEKEGYELLSEEYVNAHTKLDYICPNGHKHSITWDNWNHGTRCSYCAKVGKPTIEFIEFEFEIEGYQLLTTEYINNKQKLKYICSNGHEHDITWSDWKTGCGCPTCRAINMVGEGNHQWKGGISCEPYCDAWADKEYKQSILERDDHKCLNLCCNSNNLNDLTIHHIDYNKKNCRLENLITLCRSCNSRANKDREWHTAYYREIMRRRNLVNG